MSNVLQLHVIKCNTDPTDPPLEVGQHWINTTTGDQFLSSGTASVGDWDLVQSNLKLKVSTNDTGADFLDPSLNVSVGTNPTNALEKSIQNPGANETLLIRLDPTKIQHSDLIGIGSNTHVQIDDYISTRQHFLQYSNADAQTTTGTITLALAQDHDSVAGTSFTKVSATEFRANFTGMAVVNYSFWGTTSSNDRGFQCGILKNTNPLNHTFRRIWGKNVAERSSSAGGMFYVPVATNDVISFRMNSLEGDSATIPIGAFVGSIRRF